MIIPLIRIEPICWGKGEKLIGSMAAVRCNNKKILKDTPYG
jgi:hypothetical protein